MTVELAGFLALMALVDSTSIGTLIIPVWLMLSPRLGQRWRIVLYLVVIAAFYLVLGIALAAGAIALAPTVSSALDTRTASVVIVAVGVFLVWLSYRIDPKAKAKRGEDPGESARRWRQRVSTALRSRGGLVGLALVAGVVEAASMLPYLAAIGALSAADLGPATTLATLTAYCLVMIAPALLLLAVRVVAAPVIDRPLRRLGAWAERSAGSATAWIVGIVGVVLVLNGAGGLFG